MHTHCELSCTSQDGNVTPGAISMSLHSTLMYYIQGHILHSDTLSVCIKADHFLLGAYLAEEKLVAEVMTSSHDWTRTGIFLQPGDFRILISSCIVSCRTLGGHMSILVTTTKTGTLRARASPRCSLVMPTIPALEPI